MFRPFHRPRRTMVRLAASSMLAAVAALGPAAAAGAGRAPAATSPVTVPTWPEHPTRVVVIGDSVAESLADALATEAATRGIVLDTYTRVGCGITDGIPATTNNRPFSAHCASENAAFLDRTAVESADAVVVMSSWEVNSHTVDGKRLGFRTIEWDQWMTGQLDAIQARFRGAPLLLATVAPRAPIEGASTMSPLETDEVLRYDEFLRNQVSRRAGQVGIVDVAAILCPTNPAVCPEHLDGIRPRPDLGAHFDEVGARWLAPRVLDRIQAAWNRIGTTRTTPPGF